MRNNTFALGLATALLGGLGSISAAFVPTRPAEALGLPLVTTPAAMCGFSCGVGGATSRDRRAFALPEG
jgi:hypothetical protein